MLTLETILEATRGHLEGAHAAIDFTAVVIDSRRVVPGCLFVCLRGPSHDGHAYAESAVRDGAVGVVAAADWHGKLPMVPVVRVPDTQAALGAIARAHRRQLGLKVVAVTGSSGKTSTKEMIAAYLGARWPVAKTTGNENNEIGVPLTLLRLSDEHRAAVVEMGMRGLGEIAYLAGLAEPDVGVITNIGVAHLERLGSVEGIARAKTELWRDGPEGQIAVFPIDDPHLKAAVGGRGHLSYSLQDPEATVLATDARPSGEGQVFTARYKPWGALPGGESEVTIPLWGDHHRLNALAAIAVGLALGVTPEPQLTLAPEVLAGRSVTVEAGGVTLIDDTYNANPLSMRQALVAFATAAAPGRRYAVLGDMGELGPTAPVLHREVGALIADLPIDGLVAVGSLARHYAEGDPTARWFEDGEAACVYLAEILRPGDRVFLKASRASRLETVVRCLEKKLNVP